MQKKLIALAVAGVFAAPAFAATANVDVYGQVNLSVDFTNTDNPFEATDSSVTRVSNTASRLGFKGAEDLGGGLSAIWQVESGFDADSTAQQFTSRNTFVGLSSKQFGTVKLGKQDTPYKMATGRLDVFVDTLGDYNSVIGSFSHIPVATRATGSGSNATGATSSYTYGFTGNGVFDARESNSIMYETPNLSGFSGAVMYSARNEAGNAYIGMNSSGTSITTVSLDSKLWSISASYNKGPLFASLAWEKHSDTPLLLDTGDIGDPEGRIADMTAWKAAVAYTFGNLTGGLMYEKMDFDFDAPGGGTVNSTDSGKWYASLAYKMGNVTLKAAYARAGESDNGANDGVSQWTVGADYNLSKRTRVYALYTDMNADSFGIWTLGGNGTSGGATSGSVNGGGGIGSSFDAGRDPSGFSFGVRHSF